MEPCSHPAQQNIIRENQTAAKVVLWVEIQSSKYPKATRKLKDFSRVKKWNFKSVTFETIKLDKSLKPTECPQLFRPG